MGQHAYLLVDQSSSDASQILNIVSVFSTLVRISSPCKVDNGF